MPIAIVASIAIQVLCLIHAVRTGRTQPWLYIIVFLPLVGSIAYFVVEVLPSMANNRRARRVFDDVQTVLDPDREFRERKAEAELTGAPGPRIALAEECSRKGMHGEAVALYRSALTGIYADEPNPLLGFARVLIEAGEYAECQRTLDHLRAKNPTFESSEGHLLYARALEGQGKTDEAIKDYEALIGYFAGYEARVRYALFHQKLGNVAKARDLLEGVVKAYKQLPRHAQALNRDWYDVARRNLEG